MSSRLKGHHELLTLLEAVCEDRLSAAENDRLESLLAEDVDARKIYRQYMLLHGTLHWDTAIETDSLIGRQLPGPQPVNSVRPAEVSVNASTRTRRIVWTAGVVAAMLLVAAVILTGDLFPNLTDPGHPNLVADNANQNGNLINPDNTERSSNGNPDSRKPVRIPEVVKKNRDNRIDVATNDRNTQPEVPDVIPAAGSSDETIVSVINTQLKDSWDANLIAPSPYADDAEWLRRVHLDLIGQIPTVEEAVAFLESDDPRKRERVIDELLDRPEFVTNWSTIWANLMVGRNPERAENRFAVTKFLRDSFRENRPWDEVVAQVISAEGSTDENYASGFLLAHVNNQAVPATAIASRLFLGTNVQCTQCHDHPTNPEAKQNQFWELNSFFKQTERVVERERDPATGAVLQKVSLVTRPEAAITYYENRYGRVQPAFPIYNGVKIDDGPDTNRRRELARLLSAGDKPQIADAYVNRLWKHFFGFGFTNPVDDMGPHNAPSHPELLDRLAREFVLSGYDQKRLMKWICLSDGYRRSSKLSQNNEIDNPEFGELPLFSRVYVKSMTAEQVYNSLLVATGVMDAQTGSWSDVETQRDEWMQQFVHAYDNEENNEDTHFAGTITQALMLMNGEMIQEAISYEKPTYFGKLVSSNMSDQRKIEQMALSALTRYPTEGELAMIRKIIAQNVGNASNGQQRRQQVAQTLQDVFWAYLNSSEFVLVH